MYLFIMCIMILFDVDYVFFAPILIIFVVISVYVMYFFLSYSGTSIPERDNRQCNFDK